MKINIFPSKINGNIFAPPSKSYAHRALICAALADGVSNIFGISQSRDMDATISTLEVLGSNISRDSQIAKVTGVSFIDINKEKIYDAIESGSTLRFMIPIALLQGGECFFTGTERLIERGIGVYEDVLPQHGITIENEGLKFKFNGKLKPGNYEIPGNISSQFASGLLMALPLLESDSKLTILPPVESKPYIDITIDVMKAFGVYVDEIEPGIFNIPGNQKYKSSNYKVQGDWSNGAALLAFNTIDNNLGVMGLDSDSLQGDRVAADFYKKIIYKDDLNFDLSDCPDLGPVLFSALAANDGGKVTGIKRLRIKESDRVETSLTELKKFGIKVICSEDSLEIFPSKLLKPSEILCSHNDHRIVMAMTLLCSLTGGTIDGVESINKSFPNYFELLKSVGLKFNYED